MFKNKKKTTDTKDNSKTFFEKYNVIIIAFLIFILAFAVRGHLLKYDYLFEFDTYWHLRATGYVLQGDLPTNDPLGFYAQGGLEYSDWPQFLWFFTAIIYKVTTFGLGYDKWLLMSYARYLPAIFGALISAAMFWLGKEMYNKKTGIVMGVVAATIPAFVYRTMAGFFEEDALGFLWMVLGLVFFVKAMKGAKPTKIHLTYAILAGILFSLMAFTWGMFLLVPLVFTGYFVTSLFYLAFKNDSNKDMASFTKIFIVTGIVFMSLTCLVNGTGWIQRTTKYVTDYLPISNENIDRINKENIGETDILSKTVGEENTGKQFFFIKYNMLSFIPFLALIIIPIYLFFSKHKDHLTWLLFWWIAITLFMAWVKLKFTYTLGLPIAAGCGVLYFIYSKYIDKLKDKKENPFTARRLYTLITVFVLLVSIGAGTFFVSTKINPIVEQNDWRESFFWIYENTPEDIKIFNWWDQGHWITYFTERKASTDNTNAFIEGDANFAQFVISDHLETSKNILKAYDADYIMADTSFFSKFNSFAAYAYLSTDFSNPKISKYWGATIDCIEQSTTITNKKRYVCNSLVFSEADFDNLETKWQQQPSQIINGQPMFLYRSKNKKQIHVLNPAVNKTIFSRIWFEDDALEPFTETAYENGNVKVIKVLKENLE